MVEITFISLLLIIIRFLKIKKSKRLSSYLNQGPWGDAITYLFLIQFFRNRSCGVPDERCLIGDDNVLVPSLYMKIVSRLFNDSTLIKYPWLPNFLIFVISIPIAVTICEELLVVLLPDYNVVYIALIIISAFILFIFQKMRRQLGLDATLEYTEKYMESVELKNPRMKDLVCRYLENVDIEQMYEEVIR